MEKQLLLFDDCSSSCEAYGSCGGYRATAPCGCIWQPSSGKRYQCSKCNIICRERKTFSADTTIKDFKVEIGNGYSLDQVNITQKPLLFPVYIPTYTHKCVGLPKFSNYIAVDIRTLFNCRKKAPADFKHHFFDVHSMRKFLNVDEECKLIAVLNGPDWMLESFWAMNRMKLFYTLSSLGFTMCTGPTFSLTTLTDTNIAVPYSHHTAMLMRHHRVLSEIYDAGLCPVPNLYWIDNDELEIKRWGSWLSDNKNISTITKDFTSTRQWSTIKSKLTELVKLLDKAGRSFQILINGTGAKNATKIFSELRNAGHEVSIITSAPILKAIRGGSKYIIDENGALTDTPCLKTELAMPALIAHNIFEFANAFSSKRA